MRSSSPLDVRQLHLVLFWKRAIPGLGSGRRSHDGAPLAMAMNLWYTTFHAEIV